MHNIERIAVLDFESTGVDTEVARVVSCFVGLMDGAGELIESHSWLINPGIDIPEGASNVHGITTAIAQRDGRSDVKTALWEIALQLDLYDGQGIPLVIYNAAYDLTLLDRELRRHGIDPFGAPSVVIDPFVLDKGIDKYRAGKRTLVATAAHYGVPVAENAHDAEADCVMAGRVALALLKHPRLKDMSLEAIHNKTIPTARNLAASLQAYFRKQQAKDPARADEPPTVVNGIWPLIPFTETENAA